MRLDLGRPMAKGNFILFKGEPNVGKTGLAQDAIKQFLLESPDHKAIYVGLNQNSGQRLMKGLSEECRSRAMCIGVDQSMHKMSSEADYLLAPLTAVKACESLDKVLLVFDDVLLHKFKEQHVYGLANQPFAPINIVNEIMERTGCFSDGRTVSSIVIIDTDTNQLQFQQDEDKILVQLESMADQIIEFSDEQAKKRLGQSLPIIPSKPGQKLPH